MNVALASGADPVAPPGPRDVGRTPRWPSRRAVLVTLVLTALQGLPVVARHPGLPLPAGDGPLLYRPAALNLLHHLRFSVQDQAPYLPTITKMPGYSTFVAVVYGVAGERPVAVVVAQFALLAGTAILLGALATRRFGAAVGGCTAVLVVLYQPLFAFAPLHLSEVLTCLVVAAVLLGAESLEHRVLDATTSWFAGAIGCGVGLGALILLRQSLALLALAVAASLCFAGRRRGVAVAARRRLAALSVVAVVAGAVAGPWMVRNVVVSERFLPFGANSGLSLYVSALQYRGDYPNTLQHEQVADYVAEIGRQLDKVDAQLGPPVGTSAGMAEGIGGGPAREVALDEALKAEGGAIFATLSWLDIARALPARVSALWAPIDKIGEDWLVWSAFLLSAAGGFAVARRRQQSHWTLWIMAVYVTAFHLRFHVEARYSVPARSVLLVYAALGLVTLWRAAEGRFRLLHPREGDIGPTA